MKSSLPHDYERLLTIHGGIDQQEREKIKAAFQTNPEDSPVRILLATDAASEGIDLQNHCSHMIHIEIPYNPNVMEQRNGRIDRHGQREKEVSIWHPVDGGFSDTKSGLVGHKDDIIRALRKLDAMRKDMGSVNPVIAPQMADLLEGRIKEIDTSEAEYRSEKARKFIKAERDLKEKISKLHSDLEDTREEFHLTPERIKQTVDVGLKLAVKAPLEVADLRGVERGSVFKMPHLDGSWSRCLEGLNHPHTGKIRPITFDHEIAKDRDDVVLVHLNHRLVQMCLRLLRSEIWASEGKKIHRVDIRQLPDSELQDPAVLVVSRLVITGGKFHRLHEELTFSAGYLRERGFARETGVEKIKRWYEIATSHKAPENILDLLKKRFQSNENLIVQMVEARSKDRLNFLEKTLETRKKQEIKNIEKILGELSQAIRKELEEQHRPEQLNLV